MSRVGKQPVELPDKVSVAIDGNSVLVKGPKGELTREFNPDMAIRQENGAIVVERHTDLRHHRALHGLTRALLANMVRGVSEGFRKSLEIQGVGYQATLQGKDLHLRLGHSHPVVVEPPENISFDVPQESRGTIIHVDGIDKQVVGQVAANIRGWRPPEPYKGKGVRYVGEICAPQSGQSRQTLIDSQRPNAPAGERSARCIEHMVREPKWLISWGRRKYRARKRRHRRVRKHIAGTVQRPRLNVYRSNRNTFVQVIDDVGGRTLISCSTIDKQLAAQLADKNKVEAAKLVGLTVAERAKEAGISTVVFDRGGFK